MTDQSAADRIAAAPRAWAVKFFLKPIHLHQTFEIKAFADELARRDDGRVIPIALVPLTEKEASQ